jgi:hypothetical protein
MTCRIEDGNIIINLTNMKFTSIAVLAIFLADSQAVKLNDVCKDDTWCNKGLPYDLDEGTLRKAEADNAYKTAVFEEATRADAIAEANKAAAQADYDAKVSADADAQAAKSTAAASFAGTSYKDKSSFGAAEGDNAAAVKAKEATLDAKLKADDHLDAMTMVAARKARDLDNATRDKKNSDANLAANQARVAYEKDQLERGLNQDRLRFVNEDTSADTSAINERHSTRQMNNGHLRKQLGSDQ